MSSEDGPSPAFQQLTADNRGPVVIVASYIFLVITAIVVFTRLVTRFQIARKFALDDYLILGSISFALGQTIAITTSVNHGLGRHRDAISDSSFDGFAKSYYAARILAIHTLALAKSSTTLLIMSIHPPKAIMLACKATLILINVWAFAAAFAIIFECSPPRVWDYQGHCVNQWALYVSNVAWNVSTDIALILLPFFLMRNVQVSARKRWVVVGLFGCRIIVPAFAVAGTVATVDYWTASPPDPTWHGVKSSLWTQAVLNLSIITACIPCIKRFLADLSSGLMTVNISEPMELTMKNLSSSGNEHLNSSKPRSNRGGFLGSRLYGVSRNRSQNMSHVISSVNDPEKSEALHLSSNPNFGGPQHGTNKVRVERSESTKGLTEGVILQTIDYEVNFEQTRDSGMWDGSQGSHSNRLERKSSRGSTPPASRKGRDEVLSLHQ